MGVFQRAVAEDLAEVGLPWRGRQQIVAAHHLVDSGTLVIHHDGEVVGRHAVAAAQQLANLSGQLGAEERAIVGTQAGIGDMMRTIAGEEAMAPADALAREIALLAGLNPGLFIGNRSTGTETKSTKTKGSGLAAGLEFAYGQKD